MKVAPLAPKKRYKKTSKDIKKFIFIYFSLFSPIFLSAACRNNFQLPLTSLTINL